MSGEPRDTDADWRHIGETEPFWGVLTSPEFKQAALNIESVDYFYASGRSDIVGFLAAMHRFTGRTPPFRRALDVGCGTGRLSEAMADHADAVVGYDISAGMLDRARQRSGRPYYSDTLPAGEFDWINSYIVFQHIPPAKGYDLLDHVLSRLAPGGVTSLHFTIEQPGITTSGRNVDPQTEERPDRSSSLRGVFKRKRASAPALERSSTEPLGSVSMYDYDLNTLTQMLRGHGVNDLGLSHVVHAGHHGYIMIGERTA